MMDHDPLKLDYVWMVERFKDLSFSYHELILLFIEMISIDYLCD